MAFIGFDPPLSAADFSFLYQSSVARDLGDHRFCTPEFDSIAAMSNMATRLRITSASVVAQEETLIRMALRPFHTVPPHQHVPSAWIACITRSVVTSSPNDTST